MIAIDTNVIVRVILADDPEQSEQARAFIDANQTFVSLTVVLETAWVLTSRYGFPKERVVNALSRALGLPRLSVEDPEIVKDALKWIASGLDVADALHLAQAMRTEGFATFDRDLARLGARHADVPIKLLG